MRIASCSWTKGGCCWTPRPRAARPGCANTARAGWDRRRTVRARRRGGSVCRLDRVGFSYGAGAAVLDGFGLELGRGEIVVLSGPNGSGKTTAAKLAAGLLAPDQRPSRAQGPRRDAVAGSESLHRPRARRRRGGTRRPRRHASRRCCARGGRSRRASSHDIRATSPAVSASVLRSPRCSPSSRTCSSSTSRRGESTHRASGSSPKLLRSQADRRATLVVTHDEEFADAVADRTLALGREAILV